MKYLSLFMGLVAFGLAAPAIAHDASDMQLANAPAHAPAGAQAIPVHGKGNPGNSGSEVETPFAGGQVILRNVTYPTLTPVLPVSGRANGAAVIVAPGGGYMFLSMQNEGWRVAQRLAEAGYTAFVLKYRTRPTAPTNEEFGAQLRQMFASAGRGEGARDALDFQPAVDDAMAAVALVRSRAGEWNLDPHRVGMIGFSAGARTTLYTVLQGNESQVPDFFGYIYGPMEAEHVPANAPPMFAAIAYDDPLFDTSKFPLATAWFEAKRPVELHVYGGGSHGFGLGMPGTTSTLMLDQFIAWMAMIGLSETGEDQ